ncbi:hypothetical protein [Klebsiella aerogenes]|uniref:Uncharacterized protein n=1 Tax=Klebsiella aerogenes TaxID=548 RepID=A0AAP9U6K1_KLEAE|nr:hypothetical protein [Klebsiella aerogenes]QMR41578.1 hypothetical protein HV331_19665 [Klebsiella aerogenes]
MQDKILSKKSSRISMASLFVSLTCFGAPALADGLPQISSSVENGKCSIKVNDKVIDTYKCEYTRPPSLLSYSYLYELDERLLVFIDQPMGNACDGGPLHIIRKKEDGDYKPLGTIDFCGGHYPEVISGPKTFSINIPSIPVEGTDKTIPSEKWVLSGDHIKKNKQR